MQNGTRISCRGPALSATARSSAVYLHLLAPSPGHLTPTTVQTGRWPSRGLDMVLDTHWIRRTPRFRPPSPAAAAAAALQRQRRTEAATATPHAARRSEAGGRPPDRARGSHVCGSYGGPGSLLIRDGTGARGPFGSSAMRLVHARSSSPANVASPALGRCCRRASRLLRRRRPWPSVSVVATSGTTVHQQGCSPRENNIIRSRHRSSRIRTPRP